MIYPSENLEKMQEYTKLYEASRDIWELVTGCRNRVRRKQDSVDSSKPKPFVVQTSVKTKPIAMVTSQNFLNNIYASSSNRNSSTKNLTKP